MVVRRILCGNHKNITAWPQITVTNAVILFGLVYTITPVSALTELYTDGVLHVSWLVPDFGDQSGLIANDEGNGSSVNSSDVPSHLPDYVDFCEFGRHGLEVNRTGVNVHRISTDVVVNLIRACENLVYAEYAHRRILHLSHRRRKRGIRLIYPGTEWCGRGNRASNYDDLGRFDEVDRCCRDHDNCPNYIPDGGERGGLQNDRGYTLLSCECDEQFRTCLYGINNFNSNTIGFTYFNLLGNECFTPVSLQSTSERERLQLIESEPYVPCFRSGFFRRIFDRREC